MIDEDIKITGQIGGKVNDEELELRFKSLLKQLKVSRGLFTFSEQLRALLDEVDKSQLASEMSYGSQLTELNQLTARISEVFVNLAKQNETDRIYNQRMHEEETKKKDEAINDLKESVKTLSEDLKSQNATLTETKDAYTKSQEDISGFKGRIEDQSNTIEALKSQLTTKNDVISTQATNIKNMEQAISQNNELKLSLDQLEEEILTLKESQANEIKQKEFEFKNRLFEKEKSLQESFQNRIEKIQDQANDKYEERLVANMEKHENRVNALLTEISTEKVSHQQKVHELQEKLNQQLNTIKKITDELNTANEQNEKLTSELSKLINSNKGDSSN